jgi:hypothetical protein
MQISVFLPKKSSSQNPKIYGGMARGAPPGYPLQVPREARGAFRYYPLPEIRKTKILYSQSPY